MKSVVSNPISRLARPRRTLLTADAVDRLRSLRARLGGDASVGTAFAHPALAGGVVAGIGDTLAVGIAKGARQAVGVLLASRPIVHTDAIVVADPGVACFVRRALRQGDVRTILATLVYRDTVVVDVAGRFVGAGATRCLAGTELAGGVGAGIIGAASGEQDDDGTPQKRGCPVRGLCGVSTSLFHFWTPAWIPGNGSGHTRLSGSKTTSANGPVGRQLQAA
jgi:hypothetical protein